MISDGVLVVTDPTADSPVRRSPLSRLFGPLLRNERDMPFVRFALLMTLVMGGAAGYLFFPGNFRWWMAPVYWALYLALLGRFTLMLHNVSHNALFKKRFNVLNKYIPWVLGILVGQSPETYFVHHIGMHHAEGNLPEDLSSTMHYQRDRFLDWARYAGRFLVLGDVELYRYMKRTGRARLARRMLVGESFFFGLIAVALLWNWRAALVVFVVPLLATRVLLMIGNWTQHAFVDPDDPTNDYRTVVTFINSPYNHLCFNDGYHLGHHLKPSRHWLDMPADFLDKKQKMIEQRSLVFRKIDYFMMFVLLMTHRYERLAQYFVDLDPDNPVPKDEVVALIKHRLRKLDAEQIAAARVAA
jgi:fatty acid desaturase